MTASHESENRQLGDLAPRFFLLKAGGGAVLVGLALLLGWRSGDWERFLRGYIAAYVFVLSLCLGGLFFTMLQHLVRAGWSVVIRRIAEALAANLQWIWILFVPILVGLYATDLYHWTHAHGDPVLEHKAPYLNTTFWTIRAVLYFAVWAALARYFVRNSIAQDATGDPEITLRMQRGAAPGMILYAFTQTFAIIDWVMALEPHWFSTMFGVYYFAATCCGLGAALVLAAYALQRAGRVTESITTEHYQDTGKFLFAFGIVFWAYIGYSQYMLIWYANIQEETIWFLARQLGAWASLSIFLLVGHFVGPFLALISRWPKRWKGVLAAAAGWMLFMHFIDMYWLVVPVVPGELITEARTYHGLQEAFATEPVPGTDQTWSQVYGLRVTLADVACLLGLVGIVTGMTIRQLGSASLVPEGDPRLPESLAFENY